MTAHRLAEGWCRDHRPTGLACRSRFLVRGLTRTSLLEQARDRRWEQLALGFRTTVMDGLSRGRREGRSRPTRQTRPCWAMAGGGGGTPHQVVNASGGRRSTLSRPQCRDGAAGYRLQQRAQWIVVSGRSEMRKGVWFSQHGTGDGDKPVEADGSSMGTECGERIWPSGGLTLGRRRCTVRLTARGDLRSR